MATLPTKAMEDLLREALDSNDEKSIRKMLGDIGVTKFEPRVINQLVALMRRYVMHVMKDARDFADHGGRVDVGMDDVRMAVRRKKDRMAASQPSLEMLRALAEEVNKKPLPAIPDSYGIRLPPPQYQTTLPNLQWHVEGGADAGESPAEEPTGDEDKKQQQNQGNRNKKSKSEQRLLAKRPLAMIERKAQEEEQREREAKKARRRMLLAKQAGRA